MKCDMWNKDLTLYLTATKKDWENFNKGINNMAEKNIGGIWKKVSKNGLEFMSGQIEIAGVKHNFVVFPNNHKVNPNAPDYTILPANEYKKTEQPVPQPTASDWKSQTTQTKKTATPVCDSMFGDIPEEITPF